MSIFFFGDVVRAYVFVFFSSLEIRCSYIVIANLVLVDIYTFEVVIIVLSFIFACVVSFLS